MNKISLCSGARRPLPLSFRLGFAAFQLSFDRVANERAALYAPAVIVEHNRRHAEIGVGDRTGVNAIDAGLQLGIDVGCREGWNVEHRAA